jgi:plastocyanin
VTGSPRTRLVGLFVGCTVALLLASVGVAQGANQRVAISDYRWSKPDIQVDLGEHVTWYWTGPDTMHSVTGKSDNALSFDSDPQTGQPNHRIGDDYRVDFSQPGVYRFQCKLHSTVKGTITVSAVPGDPVTEPDPVPQSNVDLKAPQIQNPHLNKSKFGRRGTNLKFSVGEKGRLSADIYRFDARGHRHYVGYKTWATTVGFNGVRFGARSKHFTPRPGSYVALLSAIDKSQNTSEERRVRFEIRRPTGN